MEEEEEQGKVLHIVMFPWLAIGHLRPFFNLSIYLAQKGHQISFISTPRNLQRIPKIPKNLSHLTNLISFPLPEVENLPPQAESSMDVPYFKQQLLKIALDLLEPLIRSFLENANPKPDWVVYDYASHWLPKIAEEIGISRAFFALFPAAFMVFLGPPSELMSEYRRSTAEDFTSVPDWIPFSSNMAFRLHEMSMNIEKEAEVGNQYDSGTSDSMRFGLCIDGSDIVILKSYIKFEPEWFNLIHQLYKKPVFPVGVLPVEDEDDEDEDNSEWVRIREFLDLQKENSLVYVALGTKATLSQEKVHELALGLEQCRFPFFWGLNARLLEEKKVGVEIRRDEKDGSFTSREVVEAVVVAMVSDEGRKVRENARKMKELFRDKSRNKRCIDVLVHHMIERRARTLNKDDLEICP